MCRQWCDRLLHQFQADVVNKDCVLVAEDGSRVEGHRILLASVSATLASAFSGHQEENDGDEVVTVLVPASGEILHQLVTWIYFGALPKSRTADVAELAKFLRIPGVAGDIMMLQNEEKVEVNIAETESLVMEESCTTFLYVEDDATKHNHVEEGPSKSEKEETGSTMLYVEERCEEEEEVCTIIETSQLELEAPCHLVAEVEEEVTAQYHPIEKMVDADASTVNKLQNGPKIRCSSCGKTLSVRHYTKHHRAACSGELIHTCGLCGRKGFATQATLQDHIRARHTKEKPFACSICGKGFPATSHLAHHRMKKHNVNSRGEHQPKVTFPCAQCGKVLTTRPKLQAHVRVVHQGIKDFSCHQCHKDFSSKSNLEIHIGITHTGVLPYKCQKCDKSFTRKSLLSQHSASEHRFSESANPQPVLVA